MCEKIFCIFIYLYKIVWYVFLQIYLQYFTFWSECCWFKIQIVMEPKDTLMEEDLNRAARQAMVRFLYTFNENLTIILEL